MTPEIVNPVPADEIPAWLRAMTVTFLHDPDRPEGQRWLALITRRWEPERAWGVRDRGRWVATLRSEPRVLTVPGAGGATCELPVHALTNVTVAATHRRRGLMAQMLDGSLRGARERGEPLSILIAAEWPIYGRFGYAPATLSADYTFRRSRQGATLAGEPMHVRQVERDEFGDLAPAVYAAARRRRAGQIDRSQLWWNGVLGGDGFEPSTELPHNWFVHEGDDGPDGLLAWKAVGDDFGLIPPFGTVEVWDLASAGDAAYRDLWAYLSGIDVVDEVVLRNRPVDEPVRWLLRDGRTLVMTEQVDFLWLRVLDVPAALSARRYAVPGELVLEISDDAGGHAAGRFHLAAEDEGSHCEPTDRAPDLEIDQRALASIYLGGFRLAQLPSSAARELTPGALARADLMFSTPLAPWNATWF